MAETISGWDVPDSVSGGKKRSDGSFSNNQPQQSSTDSEVEAGGSRLDIDIWFNDHLFQFDTTSNLDAQHPATLYYLGQIVKIPKIDSVYVEKREDGCRKHWAVLTERDYNLMDRIYDIEQETHDRFPLADLNFRVTIDSEDGPSVSKGATKIYDSQ